MVNSWTIANAQALFDKSFIDLMFEAQKVHRKHFNPLQMQISTLLSIKTGGLCGRLQILPPECTLQNWIEIRVTNGGKKGAELGA